MAVGDWSRKVKGGDFMLGMPAKAYNKFVDAALAYEERQVASPSSRGMSQLAENLSKLNIDASAGLVEVKHVVGYDGLIIPFADNEEEYDSNTPVVIPQIPNESTHKLKWGIVVESVQDQDGIGEIVVSGPARTKVYMEEETHKFATFDEAGSTENMVSTDDTSAAPILWVEPGIDAVKEAIVYVRPFGSPAARLVRVTTTLGLPADEIEVQNVNSGLSEEGPAYIVNRVVF